MILDTARKFFNSLDNREKASKWLKAYDMRMEFDVTDGEPFHVDIRNGRVASVEAGKLKDFSIRDDISIFGEEKYLVLVFEGRLTPATAMFYGKLTPRGERAKHNQAVIAFRLMRIAQEPELINKIG